MAHSLASGASDAPPPSSPPAASPAPHFSVLASAWPTPPRTRMLGRPPRCSSEIAWPPATSAQRSCRHAATRATGRPPARSRARTSAPHPTSPLDAPWSLLPSRVRLPTALSAHRHGFALAVLRAPDLHASGAHHRPPPPPALLLSVRDAADRRPTAAVLPEGSPPPVVACTGDLGHASFGASPHFAFF
jgi:hypothetical protein